MAAKIDDIDELRLVRDSITSKVQEVLDALSSSDEELSLPVPIEFNKDFVIKTQKAKDIAHTVKRGLVEKQLLIAVNQNTRVRPIEVGYIQPPDGNGKFISAIISPDYVDRVSEPSEALKDAIIQMHTLDIISAVLGVKLVSHGITIDRIVYSVNLD